MARPQRFARRGLCISIFTIAVASTVWGQADPTPAWQKKWDDAHKQLESKRKSAESAVLRDFDRAVDSVGRAKGLTPAARTDRRNDLQAARKAFEENRVFPGDDEYAAIELNYFTVLNKAALPLFRLVDQLIEKGSKAGDQDLENRGLKMKADLEKELGGSVKLVANSLWQGTLRDSGGHTIPYHLWVGKVGSGGLFKGHVEDNPGVAGNWAYDVEGQSEGLGVQYKMSNSVRGSFTSISAVGIVSGNRLIVNSTQSVSRGKPVTVLVVVRRVK
jgi:hypothetical protein